MRTRYFLLLALFIGLGLGPAVAQDVYINSNKNRPPGWKPTIYINNNYTNNLRKDKYASERARARHNEKLKVGQDIKDIHEKIEIYYAWRASGREPKTTEEILSFANSQRAINQLVMLKRREFMIAQNEKIDRQNARRVAQEEWVNESAGATNRSSRSAKKETRHIIMKKPGLYVQPDNPAQGNKGVFTDYH